VKIKWVLDSINPKSLRRLLKSLYHRKGPGRKPYNPISMLKVLLLKHLLRIPSDRRLALHHKYDRKVTRACRFRKRTPSHDLFTQFRKRIGVNTNLEVFDRLLRGLMEQGAVKGGVVAVDNTHVHAYSQRAPDNRTGRSDPSPHRQRQRGFISEHRVHTACCANSEMPLAFTVVPCNMNDKAYF